MRSLDCSNIDEWLGARYKLYVFLARQTLVAFIDQNFTLLYMFPTTGVKGKSNKRITFA
jgi:hypothetical protein